jgi:nicotinate-nucleotide--dimethylbenzimidazole phosphoribosyltransferase
MQAGAMLQAASERRIVLVDGFVAGAAALVARGLCPAVADYLVFGHRSTEPGHRLLLIHMQAQPLLDMELRVGQGAGALMAWPLLQAAQALLARQAPAG